MICTHQMYGTVLQCFRTLGGVAHHEQSLAQAGSLFLDAARVRKNNRRFLHQTHELQVLQRLNEEEILIHRQILAKHLVDGLAHIGV